MAMVWRVCALMAACLLGGAHAGNILGVYNHGGGMSVVQYSTDCSVITDIGTVAVTIATANKCAYDPKNDILYAFASDGTGPRSVYGISGSTAAITSVTPLPFHQVHLDFDPNTGKLLVIGDNTSGLMAQYYLEIGSGNLQLLNNVPSRYGNFLGEGSAYDYTNGIQWYNAFDQVGLNSYQVGLAVKGGVYQVLDPNNGGTPAYTGSPDGSMVGLGRMLPLPLPSLPLSLLFDLLSFEGYDGNRTIVNWSVRSASTEVTSKVLSSWDITYNSQNTLDVASNILFAVLDNGPPYLDQFLVGIDMTTGATRSAVLVAPNLNPMCSFFRQ
jgi:hypothetical protein